MADMDEEAGAAGAASRAQKTPAAPATPATPGRQLRSCADQATRDEYVRDLEQTQCSLQEEVDDLLRGNAILQCRLAEEVHDLKAENKLLEEQNADKDAKIFQLTENMQAAAKRVEAQEEPEQSKKRTNTEELHQLQHDKMEEQEQVIYVLRKQIERQVAVCQAVGNATEKKTILKQASEIQKLRCKLQEHKEDSEKRLLRRETEYTETLEKIQAEHTSQQTRVESARVVTDKALEKTQSAKQELESCKKELANLQAAHAHASESHAQMRTDNATLLVTNGKLTLELSELRDEKQRHEKTLQDRENKMIALRAEVKQLQEAALQHIAGREHAKKLSKRVILAAEKWLVGCARKFDKFRLAFHWQAWKADKKITHLKGWWKIASVHLLKQSSQTNVSMLSESFQVWLAETKQAECDKVRRQCSDFRSQIMELQAKLFSFQEVVTPQMLSALRSTIEEHRSRASECRVCWEVHKQQSALLPCGHCVCTGCAELGLKECPTCRNTVTTTVKLYME